MPLCEDMESAYGKIVKMTKQLKKMFVLTYAQYLVAYLSQLLVPRAVSLTFINRVSSNYTLAFSNTPGAVKPLSLIHI